MMQLTRGTLTVHATIRGDVLLIEPNLARRVHWRKALSRAGFSVMAATSVRCADKLLGLHGAYIRLVILDIACQSARGLDFASRLTAISPGREILYIPGPRESLVVDAIRSVRPDAVLPPPFNPADLVARVRRLTAQAA